MKRSMEGETEMAPHEQTRRAAAPFSTWSLVAMMCSLVVFCPLLTLLGAVLGMKALAEVRSKPWLRGRGLAWTAIVLGLAITLLHATAAYWWHVNVRQPILQGPAPELAAGFRGDFSQFRAGFTGGAAAASDEEIARFFDELDRRYGRLISITQDRAVAEKDAPDHEEGLSPFIPYVFQFERDVVAAEAELALFADGLYPRWKSIIILDPTWGDIAFPPGTEHQWP